MTGSQHWLWLADRLSLLHSRSPCSTCGENTWHERVAVCFSWARCARKTWNFWSGFHWIAAASFFEALVGSLWHRCYKCPASAEFRRGDCQDFDLDKLARPHAAVGRGRYAPTHAGGPLVRPDVPKPIRHEHVVWEVHPESDELDTRVFGDGSLRHGRMKRLARRGWGLVVLSEEMKVTAKLHGMLLGLHQDITLAESVAFLCLRHVRALGGTFYADSLNVHRHWTRGPEYSTRGLHLCINLETDLRAHRRNRNTSHSGELGEG